MFCSLSLSPLSVPPFIYSFSYVFSARSFRIFFFFFCWFKMFSKRKNPTRKKGEKKKEKKTRRREGMGR